MKFGWRKHALITLLAVTMSPFAAAVELGEERVYSFLNEPFLAEIELSDWQNVGLSNIRIELGSRFDYESFGVPYLSDLEDLSFSLELGENGRAYILVTGRSPLREPYLDILIKASWPGAMSVREYIVLLDIPDFSPEPARQSEQPQASEPEATVLAIEIPPRTAISASSQQTDTQPVNTSTVSDQSLRVPQSNNETQAETSSQQATSSGNNSSRIISRSIVPDPATDSEPTQTETVNAQEEPDVALSEEESVQVARIVRVEPETAEVAPATVPGPVNENQEESGPDSVTEMTVSEPVAAEPVPAREPLPEPVQRPVVVLQPESAPVVNESAPEPEFIAETVTEPEPEPEPTALVEPEPVIEITAEPAETEELITETEPVTEPEPAEAEELIAETAPVTEPEPVLVPEPAVQPQPVQVSQQPDQTVNISAEAPVTVAARYKVMPGDTLWGIANDHRRQSGSNISIYQAMLSIYARNRDAFVNRNFTLLKANQNLDIPDTMEMARFTEAQAIEIINDLTNNGQARVDALREGRPLPEFTDFPVLLAENASPSVTEIPEPETETDPQIRTTALEIPPEPRNDGLLTPFTAQTDLPVLTADDSPAVQSTAPLTGQVPSIPAAEEPVRVQASTASANAEQAVTEAAQPVSQAGQSPFQDTASPDDTETDAEAIARLENQLADRQAEIFTLEEQMQNMLVQLEETENTLRRLNERLAEQNTQTETVQGTLTTLQRNGGTGGAEATQPAGLVISPFVLKLAGGILVLVLLGCAWLFWRMRRVHDMEEWEGLDDIEVPETAEEYTDSESKVGKPGHTNTVTAAASSEVEAARRKMSEESEQDFSDTDDDFDGMSFSAIDDDDKLFKEVSEIVSGADDADSTDSHEGEEGDKYAFHNMDLLEDQDESDQDEENDFPDISDLSLPPTDEDDKPY